MSVFRKRWFLIPVSTFFFVVICFTIFIMSLFGRKGSFLWHTMGKIFPRVFVQTAYLNVKTVTIEATLCSPPIWNYRVTGPET